MLLNGEKIYFDRRRLYFALSLNTHRHHYLSALLAEQYGIL